MFSTLNAILGDASRCMPDVVRYSICFEADKAVQASTLAHRPQPVG
jgi:hypothetical protein